MRRKQGFSSTTANLTVRKIKKGYQERNTDEETIVDNSDNDNEREYEGGRRRRDRRGRDRNKDRDNERNNGSNKRINEKKKKNESDNDDGKEPNRFKFLLEGLPDLLDKIKEMFFRDAAVASEVEVKNHDNMQDQSGTGTGTPLSTRNNSGKDTTKHKNSHMITRSSVEMGDGGGGESLVPSGESNEFNVYIAQSLPTVLECLVELLKGNPGPGPRDDTGTPGRWHGGGGYSDTPGQGGQGGYSMTPEYVIRVSEEGQITANTFLNATELYRRRLLSELRYKFVLIVNGKAVTHSELVELRHPSLIGEINQYFELRLLYEPTDLAIDIIAVNICALSCLRKGEIL